MMSLRLCRSGMASFAGPQSFRFNRRFLGQRLILSSPSSHPTQSRPTTHRLTVKAEMAGQYGESFDDISKHLTDLFTYKAVKTVLAQLQETDPPRYEWLYNFCVDHKPSQSHSFCKLLIKERRELGERVLKMRVSLIEEWTKRLEKIDVVNYVNEKNLEIYRETLKDSVNFIFTAKPRPELGE